MNRKARVCVVGAGWWSARTHLPAIAKNTDAELIAICDANMTRAIESKEMFGAEFAFDDIEDALKIGLVDKIGGMDEAIKEAAKLGKTSKYRIQNFPEFEKSFEDVLAQFGFTQSRQAIIKEEIGEQNYKVLQQIKQMTNQKGVQARMAYELKIN
jgi:ClpP class serine protease